MSVEQLARQLLVLNVYGAGVDDVTEAEAAANRRIHGVDTPGEVIRSVRPGGVILIGRNTADPDARDLPTRNVESLDQIHAFTRDLQAAAAEVGLPTLALGIDQENGVVDRLPAPAQDRPGGRELGGDTSLAHDVAVATAGQLDDLGLTWNYAPVADVTTDVTDPVIGDRAFADDPEVVAGMVAAQVRGFRDGGVAATAKHFPGHGAASADSHTDVPVVDLSADQWHDHHLPPFAAAIEAGVDAVMTGHLVAPGLDDSGVPATLSRPIVTGLLRDELGFDGVVVTDALWMAGVRESRSDGDVAVAALQAGVDVLLMPPDPEEAVDAIVAAVDRGDLAVADLRQSVRRFLHLRAT